MKKRKIVSAKKDLTVHELPQTRKEQFWGVIKSQYWSIFKCGVFLFLTLIPILATDLVRQFIDAGFAQQLNSGKIVEKEYNFFLFFDIMVATGIEMVFLSVFTIGLAGTNRVMKQMVYGEPIDFSYEFKQGIKENYLITLCMLLVFGALMILVRFVSYYFLGIMYIRIPLYVLLVLLIIPINIVGLVFSSYYLGNYFNVIRNSSKLYVPIWWKILLVSIGLFGVIFSLNTFMDAYLIGYVKTIVYSVLAFFILPFLILLVHFLCSVVFDKMVNIEYYPELYRKGLYVPGKKK